MGSEAAILYFLFQLWFLVLNLPLLCFQLLFLFTLFRFLHWLHCHHHISSSNSTCKRGRGCDDKIVIILCYLSLSICAEIYLVVIDQRREKYNSFLYSFSLSVRLFYSIVHFTLYIFLILLALPQDPNHRNSKAAVFWDRKAICLPAWAPPLHTRDGQAVLISLPLNLVHHLHRLRSTGHTSACGFCNM